MSAWIVSRAHIDLLVHALGVREMFPDGTGPDEVGRLLWQENVDSFTHCYDGRHQEDIPEGVSTYVYTAPVEEWSPDMLLVQVSCYDYNACEHTAYTNSVACSLVLSLMSVLRRAGAVEAADAPWGVPDCGHTHANYRDCPDRVVA